MERKKDEPDFGRFDLNAIANGFPDTAETLLLDSYLTDEEAASVRVFRVYRATP
ncbi:MAG TPA: cupin domain-containing protein, partial [Pseudolabrys sp.]|nr:cupin domain-containing protein [Pseudolabrys sp.]